MMFPIVKMKKRGNTYIGEIKEKFLRIRYKVREYRYKDKIEIINTKKGIRVPLKGDIGEEERIEKMLSLQQLFMKRKIGGILFEIDDKEKDFQVSALFYPFLGYIYTSPISKFMPFKYVLSECEYPMLSLEEIMKFTNLIPGMFLFVLSSKEKIEVLQEKLKKRNKEINRIWEKLVYFSEKKDLKNAQKLLRETSKRKLIEMGHFGKYYYVDEILQNDDLRSFIFFKKYRTLTFITKHYFVGVLHYTPLFFSLAVFSDFFGSAIDFFKYTPDYLVKAIQKSILPVHIRNNIILPVGYFLNSKGMGVKHLVQINDNDIFFSQEFFEIPEKQKQVTYAYLQIYQDVFEKTKINTLPLETIFILAKYYFSHLRKKTESFIKRVRGLLASSSRIL